MKMLKTLLSAGLFALALGGSASAYSTKAQIQSEINSNLPTNGQGAITADVLRNTLIDFMNATNFQADLLNISQVPAFTGDCTTTAGSVVLNCKAGGKSNAFSGGSSSRPAPICLTRRTRSRTSPPTRRSRRLTMRPIPKAFGATTSIQAVERTRCSSARRQERARPTA